MIHIDRLRTPQDLVRRIDTLFTLSAHKIRDLETTWEPGSGAPVFTVNGRYTARGWTEWTEGFQYGASLLQFDATGEREFLELGRERTLTRMAPHLTHVGVHDHGFNNVSTYGALWRMALEGRIEATEWERRFYALALKVSGAVQARRWTPLPDGGYIYSFNGAHSLSVDTIRSLRALALSHLLGHRLVEEQDAQVSLLTRLVQHARATATYNVFYAMSGGPFDVRGRVAHESLFNVVNGTYRGPSTQQGYSPFSTWTRGLAWAMLGFAEQLEFLSTLTADARQESGRRSSTPPAPRAISTSIPPRARTASPTGTPAHLASRRSATGAAGPPIRSTIGSPSTARPPPSAPRGCCDSAGSCSSVATMGPGTSRRGCACSTRCSMMPDRM